MRPVLMSSCLCVRFCNQEMWYKTANTLSFVLSPQDSFKFLTICRRKFSRRAAAQSQTPENKSETKPKAAWVQGSKITQQGSSGFLSSRSSSFRSSGRKSEHLPGDCACCRWRARRSTAFKGFPDSTWRVRSQDPCAPAHLVTNAIRPKSREVIIQEMMSSRASESPFFSQPMTICVTNTSWFLAQSSHTCLKIGRKRMTWLLITLKAFVH